MRKITFCLSIIITILSLLLRRRSARIQFFVAIYVVFPTHFPTHFPTLKTLINLNEVFNFLPDPEPATATETNDLPGEAGSGEAGRDVSVWHLSSRDRHADPSSQLSARLDSAWCVWCLGACEPLSSPHPDDSASLAPSSAAAVASGPQHEAKRTRMTLPALHNRPTLIRCAARCSATRRCSLLNSGHDALRGQLKTLSRVVRAYGCGYVEFRL